MRTKLLSDLTRHPGRVMFLVLALLLISGRVGSQTLVTIPAANTNDNQRQEPYGSADPYGRTQTLYTAAEIGVAGNISSIGFFLNAKTLPPDSTPIVIKLKNSLRTSLESELYEEASEYATTVFSGYVYAVDLVPGAWVTVTLPVPFTYAGYSLEMFTEVNFGSQTPDNWEAKVFRYSEVNAQVTQTWKMQDLLPGSDYPGMVYADRPNTRFFISPAPLMSYTSSMATQASGTLLKNDTLQHVLGIQVDMSGLTSPLNITALDFSTAGSSPKSGLIQNARLFYTGISPEFKPINPFGSAVALPSGPFSFSGTQTLDHGINYFWLTYDIGSTATPLDSIDAIFTQLSIGAANHTPAITNPAGYLPIGTLYDFDTTSNQGFVAVSLNAQPNQWERGIPDPFGNPPKAYSGDQCWGTNLNGKYSPGADYVVQSPHYQTFSSTINISYKEWYEFRNNTTATFEYRLNSDSTWMKITQNNTGGSSDDAWKSVFETVSVTQGDTIQFRWHFSSAVNSTPGPGWFIDNFVVSSAQTFNQVYKSSTAESIYESTSAGAVAQAIIKLIVDVMGSDTALSVSAFDLQTTGSAPGIINSARLFYTGSSNRFDTSESFGAAVANPAGAFSFSDAQALVPGKNYFWLAYDVKGTAQVGDSLDAEFLQVHIQSTTYTPAVTAPAENIKVGYLYRFDSPSNEDFYALSLHEKPNQWERGMPTTGPSAAYSGTNCWGTSLNSNFAKNAHYSLLSPQYIAGSSSIHIKYQQWYDLNFRGNEIEATFEYQVNHSGNWVVIGGLDNGIHDNSQGKWEQAQVQFTGTAPGDTVQFRWRFKSGAYTYVAPGWYIDDVNISGVKTFDQLHRQTIVSTVPGLTVGGTRSQPVISVAVEMAGTENTLAVSDLFFNTNGSGSPGIIESAKLFYSGTTNALDTTTRFGAIIPAPSGNFSFTGSQTLSHGINYFWLVYDIAPSATEGDSVDASCSSVRINTIAYTPLDSAPFGNIIVAHVHHFDSADHEGFQTASLNGKQVKWEQGVPGRGAGAPPAAYSGMQCWASNRNMTQNMQDAEYVLTTPSYIVKSPVVNVNYKEWFALTSNYDVEISFELQINNGPWRALKHVRNPSNLRSASWEDVKASTQSFANVNDTIRFRWHYMAPMINSISECWYIDHFLVAGAATFNQSYESSTTTQISGISHALASKQQIMRLEINMKGSDDAKPVSAIEFTTNGSGTVSAIQNAQLYYTEALPVFGTSVPYGNTVLAPSGAFVFNGSQKLVEGTNYFWLVYDIDSNAVPEDSVDAECIQVFIDTVGYTPLLTNPRGNIRIGSLQDFDAKDDQNFVARNYGTYIGDGWSWGTPTSPNGPATAYSGSNCWGNDLNGTNVPPIDILDNGFESPPYKVTNSNVAVSYKQWFDCRYAANPALLTFEYAVNGGAWVTRNTISISSTTTSNNEWWNVDELLSGGMVNTGDTIQFRWHLDGVYPAINIRGWFIDNFVTLGLRAIDAIPPVIEYKKIKHTSLLTNRILTDFATITDVSGIDTAAYKPRLYYKKAADADVFGGNTAADNGWKYVEVSNTTSPFSFEIDYGLLTAPAAVNDTIVYFVTAQDAFVTSNIAALPGKGFTATNVATITTGPLEPAMYILTDLPMAGTYTIGASRNYATLSAAIRDLNLRGVIDSVAFLLHDAQYDSASGEVFPLTIGAIEGASLTQHITFKPAPGNSAIISGTAGNEVFKLHAADYVTIDGSNNGSNSRDLTLAGNQSKAIVWLCPVETDGTDYNGIINCTITGDSLTLFGIYSGNSQVPNSRTENLASAPGSYNRVHNNRMRSMHFAVYFSGTENAANADEQNQFTGNLIGDSVLTVTTGGIYAGNQHTARVSGNVIRYVGHKGNMPDVSDVFGIYLQHSRASRIETNKVTDWRVTTAYVSTAGIYLNNRNGLSEHVVAQNFVAHGRATGRDINNLSGIRLNSGSGDKVYFNSVLLSGSLVASDYGTVSALQVDLYGASGADVKNNIASVNGTSLNTAKFYAVRLSLGMSSSLTFDYNVFSCTAGGAASGWLGSYNYEDVPTLGYWQTLSGFDAHSRNHAVQFVSVSDLHIAGTSIGDSLHLAGISIPGFASDIDGDVRSSVPYIGADENAGAPLPVCLLVFSAAVSGNDVQLRWSTSAEINNRGFAVERSLDNTRFEEVAFVKGQGNSQTINRYSYQDADAFPRGSATLYYRLRQVDYNGKETLSKTIKVSKDDYSTQQVVAYPNPFDNTLTLQLTVAADASAKVTAMDITGKPITSYVYTVLAGTHTIDLRDVVNFIKDPGVYLLRVEVEGVTYMEKIIKQ